MTITVVGTSDPPDCSNAHPDVDRLWPPNHKWRAIQIEGVVGVGGETVTIQATSIRQDEVVNGGGDGNTSPDGTLLPLRVRSERSGQGNGRVYHISFRATNPDGDSCTGVVKVCVPHDVHDTCVDGGPLYDSTVQ